MRISSQPLATDAIVRSSIWRFVNILPIVVSLTPTASVNIHYCYAQIARVRDDGESSKTQGRPSSNINEA
jgi:hypothetical protein